jgi:O-methyltransferase domain
MFGPKAIARGFDIAWPGYDSLWAVYEADDIRKEQFGRAMSGLEGLGGKAMAADGPFAKFKRMIDVGGSHGHFIYKVLQVNPGMKGILFDRPHVIANAHNHWYEPGGGYNDGTQERLTMVSGSFFDASAIPEADDGDVYHLRYILHDWPDVECINILKNIRGEMSDKKATLLIGESAIPDRHAVGAPSTMHHIDMHNDGFICRCRTHSQDVERITPCTSRICELVAIHPTRSLVHFVEAVPVD